MKQAFYKVLNSLYFLIIPWIPAIFLYKQNIYTFGDIKAPFWGGFYTMVLTLLIAIFLYVTMKKLDVAEITAATTILLLFSFSYILDFFNVSLGIQWANLKYVVFLLQCVTISFLMYKLLRASEQTIQKITIFLTITSISFVAISFYEIFTTTDTVDLLSYRQKKEIIINDQNTNKPDIYLFILDGHAREDYLESKFDYTNKTFTNGLKERGFFVAKNAYANYPQTRLSISSELNMNYYSELVQLDKLENYQTYAPAISLVKDNIAVNTLKSMGYKVVIFSSVANFSIGEDEVLFPNDLLILDKFIETYIALTPASLLSVEAGSPYSAYPKQLITPFVHIEDAIELNGPKLVFAHVLAPHPPFVFDSEGNSYTDSLKLINPGGDADQYTGTIESYKEAYTNQMEYINKIMLETVDEILAKSTNPPIIIIHSDHGSGIDTNMNSIEDTDLGQRFAILYAIKTPTPVAEEDYENITLVNSLRLIFRDFLDQDMELLENKQFFATWDKPYDHIDVTSKVQNK